jgi:integrase
VGLLGTLHDLPLSDITRAVAEDAVVAVARRAPRQAQLALALLKAMLRDAQQRGHRIDSGVLTLAPPSYDEREPVYLTFQQLAALASWSAEPRLILFAGLSGLRQGECFALHDKDVHLKGRYVFVSRGAYKGEPTRTKSRKRRRVYLCSEAVQVLREQLLARPAGASLVFPAPGSGMWRSENFMERVFRKAALRAGLGERDQEALQRRNLSRPASHVRLADDRGGCKPTSDCGGIGAHRPQRATRRHAGVAPLWTPISRQFEAGCYRFRPLCDRRAEAHAGCTRDAGQRLAVPQDRNPCKFEVERTGIEPVTSGLQTNR